MPIRRRCLCRSAEKLAEMDVLLAGLSNDELAKVWARCMRLMRERDLVRAANTPVGDYAERVACAHLGLDRMGFSEKSIDAIDAAGIRYQIKGRRLTRRTRAGS